MCARDVPQTPSDDGAGVTRDTRMLYSSLLSFTKDAEIHFMFRHAADR